MIKDILTECKGVKICQKKGHTVTEIPSLSTEAGTSILGDAQNPTKALSNLIYFKKQLDQIDFRDPFKPQIVLIP